MTIVLSLVACLALVAGSRAPGNEYRVFVDAGPSGEFTPAAEILAALHDAEPEPFDSAHPELLLDRLRAAPPRCVAFVVPPDSIDVDFAHRILELCTQVDDDPFPDFEYGFVTGRDGMAAQRFVASIRAGRSKRPGVRAEIFGSWAGDGDPAFTHNRAARALDLDLGQAYVPERLSIGERSVRSETALRAMRGEDFLLFFSHGYPDSMEGCFRARDLRDWGVRFDGSLLVSCACFNGCPGKWYAPTQDGLAHAAPSRDDSIALALLDTGIPAFVGGVDAWHGPLAVQVFALVVGEGLSLGAAQKRMQDRLALAFLPDRIAYPPSREFTQRFAGEGRWNRLGNGGGMIVYGDPAYVPRSRDPSAPGPAGTTTLSTANGRTTIVIEQPPLSIGGVGDDSMLAQYRLMDYFSVTTADLAGELRGECHRVVALPDDAPAPRSLRVRSARIGDGDGRPLPTGEPQVVVEETPHGRRLHVRVPIDVKFIGSVDWVATCVRGWRIELDDG